MADMVTSNDSADSTQRPNMPRFVWQRRLLTTLAVVFTALASLIVYGALLPGIPVVGAFGTLCESFFSLHIVLLALAGLGVSLGARRLGGRGTVRVTAVLSAVAALGAIVPIYSLLQTAHHYEAPISWLEHLHVTALGAEAVPTETQRYASFDDKALYVDIYLPDRRTHPSPSPSVFMVHGGGFTIGDRSQARNWDRWLAQRGYAVFDVDYRLAPPVSWNLAAQDVACAMVWVQAHARTYHLMADHVLIAGESAGGSVALQVGYGLGDGTVVSSCGGSVSQPVAVLAMYPVDDFDLAWNENLKLGPIALRETYVTYIGGSPTQFPDRYRAVSAIPHVRHGLPPTFIGYGEHDHVIPVLGHIELAGKLTAAGVANSVLAMPYGEHGYEVFWGSIGAQITRHVVSDFLSRYFPVTPPAASGQS
jgi:acetyl esterase